jgi:hypothetical protein
MKVGQNIVSRISLRHRREITRKGSQNPRRAPRKKTPKNILTLCGTDNIVQLLDEPFNLLTGLFQLLFVVVQTFSEIGAVGETIGELERRQPHGAGRTNGLAQQEYSNAQITHGPRM